MGDFKISELDALAATPDDADILAIVDDVVGTPITKKITVANLLAGAGVPVKATGAELTTATDDAKFATAKAIKDSHNVPNVVPSTDGKVMTSNGTDWISETPATVPVKATGTEINTGTDDAKFATAKAIADSKLSFISDTETLTNKRITDRVATFTSDATPDVNSDNYDAVTITALAVAITDVNITGTETNFQKLIFRIKDNGTARAIAWGDDFEDAGIALPTTTVISKLLTVGFIYDSVSAKWGCVAVANQT